MASPSPSAPLETIADSSNVALVWDGSQVENGRWMGSRNWTAECINLEHAGMYDGYSSAGVYDPNMKGYGGVPFDYNAYIPMGQRWNTYWKLCTLYVPDAECGPGRRVLPDAQCRFAVAL